MRFGFHFCLLPKAMYVMKKCVLRVAQTAL